MNDEPQTFDENTLRAEIVKVWGEYGAHIDVFDHMLRLARTAPVADPPIDVGLRDELNAALHCGAKPCGSACTHVLAGRWTALGAANVLARADARETANSGGAQ